MWLGGAMMLLLTRVDTDTIQLVRWCKIDNILKDLLKMAKSLSMVVMEHMVLHGDYKLIPRSHKG